MSKMMLRSSGKPPLAAARSPIRLRSRSKPPQPPAASSAVRSPLGSFSYSKVSNHTRDTGKSELRPEYHSITCELEELANMVYKELGSRNGAIYDGEIPGVQTGSIFERGRFYEEYSARRNERLRRKKSESEFGYEKKPAYDLGVRVESAMKREASKYSSRGKMTAVAAAATPERAAPTPRYSLRSSSMRKENKKPLLPPMNIAEKSVGVTQRKGSVRRVRKI
ncbi:uncharacterized protein LOC127246714 [Andrographis paniculata]|uniref:uncharacterized protein LOC127246714 n=1 Tax=Andrographis paniculata TaxID=175694 RepID=UPI0021E85D7F|nr:uncharacterized protein LOC127246714 [Andrographis paniculata]